ncbi:hypothetical protein PHLCEN_2v12888 [Hermanssonia centrifuga]|uniref:DUF3295 domain-containing protein n=1 Tax=Hermanssonia centrifuga TaxID=98765 RepID=A0A2R6NFR5_9APHY|nr:hypothetical protein PHLCEN_2v12888 [Hermanssonia centrifuga]
MPAPPRGRSNGTQRVGSIILNVLPGTVVGPAPFGDRRNFQRRAPKASVCVVSQPGTARPSPTVGISGMASAQTSARSIVQPRPVVPLPTLNLPSTPPNTGAPRVVVVNPTPHPTPPATPHPPHSTAAPPPTLGATAFHLTPPPLRLALAAQQPQPPAQLSLRPKPDAAAANPEKSVLPHVQQPSAVARSRPGDETLKPSDRRFFLQSAESPDIESPERVPPVDNKSSDQPEPSPSSGTSSNIRSDGIVVAPRRPAGRVAARRGKDVPRFTSTRSTNKVHTQKQISNQRKAHEPKKTTFNIGSVSSNGTRAESRENHREQSQKVPSSKQNQTASKARQPSPPKHGGIAAAVRKGLTISTSSDYTTESDDDSEWASEDNSMDEKEKEKKEKEKERQKEETRLREAAEEAQRQRDMFAKAPKRSYSNLNRTKSGLLSQLLNPDPEIFPPNHPYRSSYSSQDITQLGKQGRSPAPQLTTSKSSAALPLAAQITPLNAQAPSTNGSGNGYRPKGPPQGQELEDETDTEEESTDNVIQLSHSLAQQRLAALAGPSRRRASEQTVSHVKQSQPSRPTLPTVATAPIPLGHPYNLPAPAPPMTPRTTRRQMLSTELSESLRRNLLWERQVSKVNMLGGARRNGLLSQRLQPMTAVTPQQELVRNDSGLDEREQRKRAVARNRSWADDYHHSGW